jgi:hypothetical protein
MSLIKTLKSRDPRADPRGTPERTSKGDGRAPGTRTRNYHYKIATKTDFARRNGQLE